LLRDENIRGLRVAMRGAFPVRRIEFDRAGASMNVGHVAMLKVIAAGKKE
jgi:hypothetical protein